MKTRIFYAASLVALVGLTSACNTSKNANQTGTDTTAVSTTDTTATSGTAKNNAFNTGTFTGEVPVGKAKSDVEITFNADSTFALKEIFKGEDGKATPAMASEGKWKYDAEAKKIYLAYKNLMDRGTSFSVVDEKTIQMHDGSHQTKQTDGAAYNLTRK
ncbi:hypothetical protein TH53_05040 [Pedobacter lusitanus]|uniref:Uncharacterized protein n=1 Tax=Pedobacter lusitanus TaxID=1503925 RepID=A0A0D0GUW6_9SPHI|nr:copper resistance protein NlpE N-terminal domain-containing protein [Pedobacter lusitanus]KIO78216.1 hypothetical protein TH53_05040 [Pedobacter lusitanus]